ncbi:TetR/AcrR family transcriptional regulator [Paenibacillus typhae]|uniref:TetR/AcrR family transcriptional regulator n=1 Tax=Paenibacillus typhae TaxID=1174501 RepID=UPI001C8E855C|nr:TetR/AcrR family transcriptional regulator [Paenibacillus typhae]MBY0013480.1 TetR/AcrR family transcriptional regulator [Paenibacillus typhae]
MMAARIRTLREIKKEATAQILAQKAFELAMERGLAGFVIEDVVQRAGYSRRTFANYYSCKEEAVAMAVMSSYNYNKILDMIDDLPLDASPLEVMYQISQLKITKKLLLNLQQLIILSKKNPTLQPYVLKVLDEAQVTIKKILDFLFNDRYSTKYIRILARVVCAAIFSLVDDTMNELVPGQEPRDLLNELSYHKYIDNVFEYLRDGF